MAIVAMIKRRALRIASVAIVLPLVALGTASCGSSDSSSSDSSTGASTSASASSSSSSASSGKTIAFRVVSPVSKSDVTSQGMDLFARRVAALSHGKLKAHTYYSGQLGSIQATEDATRSGAMQMNFNALDYLGTYYKPVFVLDLPYIFPESKDAWSALGGPLGKRISKDTIAATGVRMLDWFSYGYKGIADKARSITSPADLKGLKIRTTTSPIEIATFKAWGAVPSTTDWAEVYTAIQQGVLDGVDSPVSLVPAQKFNEVAKYYSVLDYTLQIGAVQVNEKWFDSLAPDLQNDITKAAATAAAFIRKGVDSAHAKACKTLDALKMECNTLTPAQHAVFVQSVQPIWNEYKGQYGAQGLEYFKEATSKPGA